jgi:hypothetical protein
MNIKAVVLFVIGLVVGVFLLIELVPPVVHDLLNETETSQFTGLTEGLQLVPFVALAALVIGCLIGLFVEFHKDKDDWG